MIKIDKPIVFFDLETTGIDVINDRIVQIACIKMQDGKEDIKKTMYFNPMIPISKEAEEVHGITNDFVKDKPTFSQLAKSMYDFFHGCDLGGYNSNSFDVPLLYEEFARCGITFLDWEYNLVDVFKIEHKLNSMKLGEVYKRYTNKELENSHDAIADIEATIEILKYQSDKLEQKTSRDIDLMCQGDKKRFDISGKLYINNDNLVCWSFGKYKDQPITIDTSYLDWFLKNNLPSQLRQLLSSVNLPKD